MAGAQSKSEFLAIGGQNTPHGPLAPRVDAFINSASADRDVISVAIVPLNESIPEAGWFSHSYTFGVVVTVVWRT
ncbi:MAG: hypothetical protein QOJ29_1302 [Thermoleophilaceae bacterium]|nr:hypothetical protein [Thermoleophilaceae bacterium]